MRSVRRTRGTDSHGASAGAHGGVREPAVEARQVLERAGRRVGRDAPRPVGERAATGREVFEQEHEVSVVAATGPVGARDSEIDGRGHVRIELRLALSHPTRADHLAVCRVQRRELDEQRMTGPLRASRSVRPMRIRWLVATA